MSTRPTLGGITGAARRLAALLLLLAVVEVVVVLCLPARLHVGHRTAGGASRISVVMTKLPHFFATCTRAWMALSTRNAPLRLFPRFRDCEPLEHAPWTPSDT